LRATSGLNFLKAVEVLQNFAILFGKEKQAQIPGKKIESKSPFLDALIQEEV
jgi:hypothetical protein